MHTFNYWTLRSVVLVFLTRGVIECNISYRRSVEVFCMLYKIRCDPMHPRNGALPVSCMTARVTSGALVAHRNTNAASHCRTS